MSPLAKFDSFVTFLLTFFWSFPLMVFLKKFVVSSLEFVVFIELRRTPTKNIGSSKELASSSFEWTRLMMKECNFSEKDQSSTVLSALAEELSILIVSLSVWQTAQISTDCVMT
jgi:hypothetical protein